jgi:hypothetical protein
MAILVSLFYRRRKYHTRPVGGDRARCHGRDTAIIVED